MNANKQADKIVKDTNIEDFTINYNDNYRNININCSSGFYLQVARPTLNLLTNDQIESILGTNVIYENATQNMDNTGNEFNITLFFKLVEASGKSAKVTIHTHHSTRMVQVQGGKVLADKSTAALWFVQNVIYNKFKSLAHSKSLQITALNKFIEESYRAKTRCDLCNFDFDSIC